MANLLETAANAGSFQTLIQAIEATEVADMLNSPGFFTVLAPTDEAFSALPSGTLEGLLDNRPLLKRIVMYHILSGDVRSDDLAQIDEAPTEEGSIVAVERSQGGIKINQAQVTQLDLLADNGVIHAIDQVLIPGILEDNL
ncbi:MAG: fasciclin domain-containing protein [Oscillatoriophycideae cyanobacterium NC_groundwater_1537_Pr4_S-0.65um_50_18]|nr:fasciclin domain-containing protein [Oscillatoriophycideae cyanobacterium NC_groundwater_1537_Pr4_S-0.65um_50_18]